MAKKQANKVHQPALAASSKDDWFAHIRTLGLSSAEEYQKWCHKHGFKFNRKKTWRQEREERQVAQLERTNAAALQHIQALGLKSADEYLEWCRAHSFRDRLDKKDRQRRKELDFAEQLNRSRGLDKGEKPPETVPAEHIRALGLESVDAYRTWCLENGLSDALNKIPEFLHKERQIADLAAAKYQRGRTRTIVQEICAKTIALDELKSASLRRIHAAFADQEEHGRDALLHLLLHVEHCADLLNTATAIACWGRQPGNTFIEGVLALGRHHRDWLRPVDTWRPTDRNQRPQFSSLARHLLAQYQVPVFMDAVWFRAEDEEVRRQQGWFKHIGAGGNIRTADVPTRLSKKMAHHFLEAPDHYTVEEALRWGQIIGQDGIAFLVEAVNATRLGKSFENEKFWNSVFHFFARQSNLKLDQVGPIVDYIHNQKFEEREATSPDGRTERQPPPQPNFSMKSRSVPKLLRQVDQWRQRSSSKTLLQKGQWDNSRRRKFAYLYLEEEDERTGHTLAWSIQELATARALTSEGEVMRHCVANFTDRLRQTSIWSLQVRAGDRTHRVMTIAIDNEHCIVTQARGRFNADLDRANDEREAAGAGGVPPGAKGKLNGTDRFFLQRSYKILRFWLEREGIAYSQF